MEQNGPRTTRVDRLWLRACGVILLMTFGTVAVLMTIEEHRFARAHRLEVDYNAFAEPENGQNDLQIILILTPFLTQLFA